MKNIVMGPIPGPNQEPALEDITKEIIFSWFIDDDVRDARIFEQLLWFLDEQYFPRLT